MSAFTNGVASATDGSTAIGVTLRMNMCQDTQAQIAVTPTTTPLLPVRISRPVTLSLRTQMQLQHLLVPRSLVLTSPEVSEGSVEP